MLNIIKSKLKNTYKKKPLNSASITIRNKDFVPAVRDWKNSIYVYNKNSLSLIPVAGRLVMKLVKSYLLLYNLDIESELRKDKLRPRDRKLSLNKIFVSDGEFKHTNDNVNITLYVYNRQKLNYLLKLKNIYISLFKKVSFVRKLQLIRKKGLNILNQQQEISKLLTNLLPGYSSELNSAHYYTIFIDKAVTRLEFYLYYRQLLYINKAKFENSYLQGLKNLIIKIYKKNVEFNIINLKYFYFNSDILTQPLELKLKKKRLLTRYLNDLVKKAKIKNIKLNVIPRYFFELDRSFRINNSDTTNNLLNKLMQQNKTSSLYLKKVVLNDIKYKRVAGIRIGASGRLTKRFTASRSNSRFKYCGNLENNYSSIKAYPSSVIRGNYKPNLQYTNINSKTRIGSFGVKGWVSGV